VGYCHSTARSLALAAVLALALLASAAPALAAQKPNVVVVMTDDQDFRSMPVMPQTRNLIAKRGTTFATSIVSFPLCCPSRATYLTGQYAHNHGVKWNFFPEGGYEKLKQAETLPVWLRRAGYRTIHIGKFLNQTGVRDAKEVPKGWDDWHGGVDPTTYDYYGYTLNNNGVLRTYGRGTKDYATDVYAGLAEKAIRDARKAGKPFFLNIAPLAPHTVAVNSGASKEGTPALPAPRDAGVFAQASLPRYPNFNEADMSDKPALGAFFSLMTDDQIASLTDHYRGRMGSLLAVDDLVTRVVNSLKKAGVYGNTDIIFTSDNGWILGEHRLRDPITEDGRASGVKYLPYEGSSRVPLMAAGPDFPVGKTVNGVVVNADLAPTIADIAGAHPKLAEDGISLLRALRTPSMLAGRGVLLEAFSNPRGTPPYTSIRTERYRYDIGEVAGSEGLYDLKRDPWELDSRHDDPRYAAIKKILIAKLAKLKNCKGVKCQVHVGTLPEPLP
jgi:arylsulfatase A-like enzyme